MTDQRYSRSRGLVFLLAAAALVALGAFLLFVGPDPEPKSSGTPQTTSPSVPPISSPSGPPRPDQGQLAEGAEQETTEEGAPPPDAELQRLLDQTSSPNLPHDQEKALVALASRVLIADVTGKGREEFPGYWQGEPPVRQPITNIRTQAGIARAQQGRPDRVDVTLLWAGRDHSGKDLDRRRALIRLAYANGRWVPVNDVGPNPSP